MPAADEVVLFGVWERVPAAPRPQDHLRVDMTEQLTNPPPRQLDQTDTSPPAPKHLPIVPDFVLLGLAHAKDALSYDPDLGVLTILRDRYTELGDVQVVLPAQVDGRALTVTVESAPGSTSVESDGASHTLPPLALFEEMDLALEFTPPPSAAAPIPVVKVKIALKVRPKGGGG